MFETDRFIADCRGAGVASGPSGVLEVVSAAVSAPAEQHTVNGTPNAFWKSRMTSSGCWRSSRSRTACMPRHDVRYRRPHNPALERTRCARRSPQR
jgi:hypothetical protein